MPRVKKRALPSASIPIQWQAAISDHVIALAWSPDGRWLAAAAVSGPISLFDGVTGQCTAVLAGHHLGTTSLSWHADSTCLASAGQDGLARFWDASTGREQQALDAGAPWFEGVAWSPTGTLLATAAGRTLQLWDAAGRLLQQYPAQASTIAALQWAAHCAGAPCDRGAHHGSVWQGNAVDSRAHRAPDPVRLERLYSHPCLEP